MLGDPLRHGSMRRAVVGAPRLAYGLGIGAIGRAWKAPPPSPSRSAGRCRWRCPKAFDLLLCLFRPFWRRRLSMRKLVVGGTRTCGLRTCSERWQRLVCILQVFPPGDSRPHVAPGGGGGAHILRIGPLPPVRRLIAQCFAPCTAGSTHTERVDCLLYTSPSPRDATLSRMPSSA